MMVSGVSIMAAFLYALCAPATGGKGARDGSVSFHRCYKYCQVGEHNASSGNVLSTPPCNSTPHVPMPGPYMTWRVVVPILSIDPFGLVVILVAAVFLRESVGVKVALADDNG